MIDYSEKNKTEFEKAAEKAALSKINNEFERIIFEYKERKTFYNKALSAICDHEDGRDGSIMSKKTRTDLKNEIAVLDKAVKIIENIKNRLTENMKQK